MTDFFSGLYAAKGQQDGTEKTGKPKKRKGERI